GPESAQLVDALTHDGTAVARDEEHDDFGLSAMQLVVPAVIIEQTEVHHLVWLDEPRLAFGGFIGRQRRERAKGSGGIEQKRALHRSGHSNEQLAPIQSR